MLSPIVAKVIQFLPEKFVTSLSKKIVNNYIDKYATIELNGKEILKDVKKPIIFICNHLSNADGLILNRVLESNDVTFIAGIKLSDDPVTNLGINIVKTIAIKPNTADKEAISKIVRHVKDGGNILIFPEGTRSRTGSMIEAKKGILLIAKLTKATVIPIGIYGTEKLLPISEGGSMASEKFTHAKVRVNFGQPIDYPDKKQGEERHEYEERALQQMMGSIAKLLPEQYRGVYADKLENFYSNME